MPDALRLEALRIVRRGAMPIGPADFAVAPGEIVSLVGPNGAGKTSIVRAILGLVRYEGRCLVGGVDATTLDPAARARLLAWVPQRSLLDASLTAREVVAMARFAYDGFSNVDHPDVRDAIRTARIDALADRPFPRLSVGEQRRVLVARAIASEAPLLLLDEPDAAFDVAHRLLLFRLLSELRERGRAILLVAHGLDDLKRLSDRCVLLHEGRQMAQGSPSVVLSTENVRRIFGVEIQAGSADAYNLPKELP